MWSKSYQDYKVDKALIKYRVESGKGIVGCEMHEYNGWNTTALPPKQEGSVCSRLPYYVDPYNEIDNR